MKKLISLLFCIVLLSLAKAQNEDIINFETVPKESNEKLLQQWIAANRTNESKQIITIPVVVHIVYNNSAQNLSNSRILEQIDVLNTCYNDTAPSAPAAFDSVAANCEIRFCLARRTPNGDSTDGIDRKQTTVSSFSTNDNVKHNSTGGVDAWDVTKYLNIWVCNLGQGLVGYAEFPTGTPSLTDGLVMHYQFFGITGATSPYNGGKSTVHELGHWLNLYHICCSEFYLGCPDNDGCADTPPMNSDFFSCSPPPPPIEDSCTNNPIYGNYMQYSDDNCLTFFTNDQKDRMHACLNVLRPGLLTSDACTPPFVEVEDYALDETSFYIFPNPAEGIAKLKFHTSSDIILTIKILDITGRLIASFSKEIPTGNHQIPLNTKELKNGAYIIHCESGNLSSAIKMIVCN